MKTFSRTYVLWLLAALLTGCRSTSSSLDELDRLVEGHQTISEQYQIHIDSLYIASLSPMTDTERFGMYGQLFDSYRAFNIDSQLVYAEKRIDLSARLSRPSFMQVAQFNRAEVLMRSGMYHEAKRSLDEAALSTVASDWQPYYFHLRRTLYGLMEDFAITESDQTRYHQWTQAYRDSFLTTQVPGSFFHVLVHADALAAEQQNEDALTLLSAYESEHSLSVYEQGLFAITQAQIYAQTGQREARKQQLIIASCADLRGAAREYIALRDLARMLYEEGDTDRAYRYIHCALEDAKAGGMRGRASEMSTTYLIIESAYLRQETIRKQLLYGLLASIVLLAGMLSLFLIYSARKRKQLAVLNELLRESNTRLHQSNLIKNVYIGRYMKMTTLSDFDDAFLELFPDFVAQIRDLLVPEAEIRIKPKERLNTDLRVLALIHLGFTDSHQIADFLRYSLPTIYNSRTRMRNLAKGDRDTFEQKVATL